MNLRQFFIQQPDKFIVLLDRLQRFNEDGLSARTCAMNHALHAAFLLHLHRDHKPFPADGDEFVLQ